MHSCHVYFFALLAACTGGSDAKLAVYETEPDLTIISPVDGAEFNQGEVVNFEALVSDDQDY